MAACGGGHRHGPPIDGDPRKLYVEISAGGSHESQLRAGAGDGLSRVAFAIPMEDRGEIELDLEVSDLDVAEDQTVCKVKVLVLRLPNHSLLGIADGSAQVRGTSDDAGDACVERLGAELVRGKVRVLLKRLLRAKQ